MEAVEHSAFYSTSKNYVIQALDAARTQGRREGQREGLEEAIHIGKESLYAYYKVQDRICARIALEPKT